MGNILLFPLRLLVFLVRLPIALVDTLVFFLYALVLYALAIPAFLVNAIYQLVAYPARLARGRTGKTNFRLGWFLKEPLAMFLRKEKGIASWLGASWRTFESRRQREARQKRLKTRYQSYFQREEPVLYLTPKTSCREADPHPPTVPDDRAAGQKVTPASDHASAWPCKNRPVGFVRLHCPHCGALARQDDGEYPVQYPDAVVFQFTRDPGEQYTGGDGCGVLDCATCGRKSYMVEVTEDKGIFNLESKQWESEPALRAMPVGEVLVERRSPES